MPSVAVAELNPGVDKHIAGYLGHLAIFAPSPEGADKAQSRMYEGLSISLEEASAAIDEVERVEELPGVRETMDRLKFASQYDVTDERQVAMETIAHERRVAIFAVIAARRADLTDEQVEAMAIAGLIHDNGKADRRVLPLFAKKGTWTEDERRATERHPEEGALYAYTSGVKNRMALDLTATHHLDLIEKEERHVRPYGNANLIAAGEQATELMRDIFSVCDYLDARCNPRIYRPDRPVASAQIIAEMPSDLQTLPEVQQLFENMIVTQAPA